MWTRERARREGVSVRRLTGGVEFVRVVPGAYVEACWADDLRTRCAAVLNRLPSATFSHWTGLSLQGLPVPGLDGPVEVTVSPGGRLPRWPRVLVHRSTSIRPVVVDELPVSGAVRAWVDAAASVDLGVDPVASRVARSATGSSSALGGASVPGSRSANGTASAVTSRPATRPDLADLVAVGDALLRRRPGTVGDVLDLLTLRPAVRGSVAVRRALELLDPGAESPMESRLRVVLSCGGLAPPAVQHVVTDRAGRFVARVVVVTGSDVISHPQEVVYRVRSALSGR